MITANKPKDQVVIYTIHESDRGQSNSGEIIRRDHRNYGIRVIRGILRNSRESSNAAIFLSLLFSQNYQWHKACSQIVTGCWNDYHELQNRTPCYRKRSSGLPCYRTGYRRVCESATRLAGTRKGHLDHRSQERLARERRRRETAGDARGERSTNQKLSTLYP